jgi:prepilin-type N-terminal cleavage/methylation domain-containing protein
MPGLSSDTVARKHQGAGTAEKGFTLVELLVTMVIISAIIGLVGPSMFKTVDKIRVESEKKQLAAILAKAETLSFCRNSPIIVRLNEKNVVVSLHAGKKEVAGQFAFLTFENQTIAFNQNGFADTHEIGYLVDGQKKRLLF